MLNQNPTNTQNNQPMPNNPLENSKTNSHKTCNKPPRTTNTANEKQKSQINAPQLYVQPWGLIAGLGGLTGANRENGFLIQNTGMRDAVCIAATIKRILQGDILSVVTPGLGAGGQDVRPSLLLMTEN